MTGRRAGWALLLALLAWPAEAQIFRYMAFGDSITKGRLDFDPTVMRCVSCASQPSRKMR